MRNSLRFRSKLIFALKRGRQSEKGQISIMIGVMMTTFILFFAFVINTGMLVNAKINLQNAADMAAFAGAAVEARQLTHISYLNYEMRRQWKKFLFRIYVLGNMAQDSFQESQGQEGPMVYYPNTGTKSNYTVPSTCIMFNSSDNFCHLDKLPRIQIPPSTFLDSISDTLRDQLSQIETIRQNNCKGIGLTNLMVNLYWLYSTDPDMKSFSSGGSLTNEQVNALRIVQGLTTGLGIVPRELILSNRINTLVSYVNSKVQSNLTKATVDGFLSKPDPLYFERAVQAFYSAYYTLGNHTFPGGSVVMDELLPGDTDGALILKLKEIKQRFDTYSINPSVGTTDSSGAGDCEAVMNALSVPSDLTVGFYKDPTILTYYAIRLKAKAQILFSPFGDMELKAYAAAQPFGSRIGPVLTGEHPFAHPGTATPLKNLTSQEAVSALSGIQNFIPNLPVKAQDSYEPQVGTGWDTKEMLSAMYGALGLSGKVPTVGSSNVQRAYHFAMAPNPWEATRYNIINDQGTDPFIRNFDQNDTAAFWAPVFSPSKSSTEVSEKLNGEIDRMFTRNGADDTNAGTSQAQTGAGTGQSTNSSQAEYIRRVKATVTTGLTNYLSDLKSGKGEDQEGMNIVRISNPFKFGNEPISGRPDLFMTEAEMFKSSWNSVSYDALRTPGRVGYSVKFVAFDALTAHKLTTDGQSTWSNALALDPEAQSDVPYIKH